MPSNFTLAIKAVAAALFPGSSWGSTGTNLLGRSHAGFYSVAPRNFDYHNTNVLDNGVVMQCVNWIVRNFGQARLTVSTDVANNRPSDLNSDHPVLELLRRPNAFYGGQTLWAGTLMSYNVDGNAYWLKVRNGGAGAPVDELWYVPHWQIEPFIPETVTTSTFIDSYRLKVGGQVYRLEVDDVVHFRNGLNPYNPRKGMSPLHAVLAEVFTDNEATMYTAALLKNSGGPGAVMIPKEGVQLTTESAMSIKEKFKRAFGGDNRGEPMIMTQPMTLETFAFSPEQMNLSKLRQIPEARISGALGLPAMVAGLNVGLEHSTYSNYEQAEKQAFEQNLVPTWMCLADQLDRQLLPDFDTNPAARIYFDTSHVKALKESENDKQDRARNALAAGGITVNEFRQMLGLDETVEGNVYLLPSSCTPMNAEAITKAAEAPQPQPAQLAPGMLPPQLTDGQAQQDAGAVN